MRGPRPTGGGGVAPKKQTKKTPKTYVSEPVVRVLQSVRGLIYIILNFFDWFNKRISHYLLHS